MSNDYTATLPLPDGAMAQHGVLSVAYFDPDGNTKYGFSTQGDAPLSSLLGLLELVKAHLLVDEGHGS
jgi:hypothetical protein